MDELTNLHRQIEWRTIVSAHSQPCTHCSIVNSKFIFKESFKVWYVTLVVTKCVNSADEFTIDHFYVESGILFILISFLFASKMHLKMHQFYY